ncbi:hypothetical protein HAX54_011060 [Datura stramonium]|uniref:Uncharacterized protein n=1 Tax=Datura stramonium TaxID=4076 RepID=A0ABS8TI47_DATST|nr:hypothetical protein [Datura stramonium]
MITQGRSLGPQKENETSGCSLERRKIKRGNSTCLVLVRLGGERETTGEGWRKGDLAAIWVLFAREERVKEAVVEVRRKGWRRFASVAASGEEREVRRLVAWLNKKEAEGGELGRSPVVIGRSWFGLLAVVLLLPSPAVRGEICSWVGGAREIGEG